MLKRTVSPTARDREFPSNGPAPQQEDVSISSSRAKGFSRRLCGEETPVWVMILPEDKGPMFLGPAIDSDVVSLSGARIKP